MQDKGIIAVILALLVFVLAGLFVIISKKPTELQCTVDDTLSFTATGVTEVRQRGSQLFVILDGEFPIHRNMLPGETCTQVKDIDWSLAR